MSNKILKIKRVFAWAIFDNLKRTPPKDYLTTGEIKSTIVDVLPALKVHVDEYVSKIEQATELNDKVLAKEITEDEVKAGVEKINEEWRNYNKEHGNEAVDVCLNDEGLKTLKAQFDREDWGKKWVANIEEFGELLEAFVEAGK